MGGNLWIGWDPGGKGDVPALSVFERRGDSFVMVKMFEGECALMTYKLLTEEDDWGNMNEAENTVQGL